jgi:hypothetical protein
MGALTAIALCAVWPALVGAEQTVIPPEANWTPTPPARSTVDLSQLVRLLMEKGMITPKEYTRLTYPQLSSPSPQGNGRVRTWVDIDAYQRSPINSSAQGG